MSHKEILVDVVGKLCPIPVIEAKKAMEADSQAYVRVVVDNEVSRNNVVKLGAFRGYETHTLEEENRFIVVMIPKEEGEVIPAGVSISKSEDSEDSDLSSIFDTSPEQVGPNRVILLTKDYLGEGSRDLGESLMKTFLYCLTEAAHKPKAIYCINSGVHMVCEASPYLEHLQVLHSAGVYVGACGICLDYYHKRDLVQVGDITNMYAIVEAMMDESMVTL